MKYLLVEEDGEIYAFTEKEYYKHIVDLQDSGFDFEGCVIKQADTIEELCDMYVIWLKDRELSIIERMEKGYRIYPSYFEVGECSFDKGYGAIWAECGLKYIAELNEKGELELL